MDEIKVVVNGVGAAGVAVLEDRHGCGCKKYCRLRSDRSSLCRADRTHELG
jgi:malic enzyme